jgi:hypothetical protein
MQNYLNTAQLERECPDRPYLARLGDVADELERVGDYLQAFIDRCRGAQASTAASSALNSVPSGHFGQLDRVQTNLGRVDALARELQTIG